MDSYLRDMQVCDLAHCSESVLGIILSSVQQQPIAVDCGVFAMVLVVDLLNRFAKTGCFDVGSMRSHLLKMFGRRRIYIISEKP